MDVANQQQVAAWNGGESVHYVDHAERYDRQLVPFLDALLEHAQLEGHHRVLDIGCGCGATTIAAARSARQALGVDISEPLLEIATRRASAAGMDDVEFLVADAQTYPFVESAWDLVISQFGLMFFDEPGAAFANLRRALVPGGRLGFVTWQGLDRNEWLMVVGREVARRASLPELGALAGGPGMFALQDPDEITALLEGVGFSQVRCESIAPTILVGGGGSLDGSVDFLLGMGMVRGLLGRVEPDERLAAIDDVRAALARRYEPGVGVRLGASAWLVSADR